MWSVYEAAAQISSALGNPAHAEGEFRWTWRCGDRQMIVRMPTTVDPPVLFVEPEDLISMRASICPLRFITIPTPEWAEFAVAFLRNAQQAMPRAPEAVP
jgi:hypothetical protein